LKSSIIENDETDERGRFEEEKKKSFFKFLKKEQKYAKVPGHCVCFYQKRSTMLKTTLQRHKSTWK
jgi:hypothetical protein